MPEIADNHKIEALVENELTENSENCDNIDNNEVIEMLKRKPINFRTEILK